nr:hypothetical protein [Denitromonas halophila]
MDVVCGTVNHHAAFASSKSSFRVQSEIAAFDRVAKGFVVNAAIYGVQRKPIVPTRKEVSERTEQAAGLAVEDVVGARRDRADAHRAGLGAVVCSCAEARESREREGPDLEHAQCFIVEFERAMKHIFDALHLGPEVKRNAFIENVKRMFCAARRLLNSTSLAQLQKNGSMKMSYFKT